MVVRNSIPRKVFLTFNYTFLAIVTIVCLLPFIYLLAISFSSNAAIAGNKVFVIPVDFTIEPYHFVLRKNEFLKSVGVSFYRIILGVPLGMLMTVLAAYPLSKNKNQFRYRSFYSWYFIVTMVFSGGMIPGFIIMKMLGLIDSIGALVLPMSVSAWNIILMMNFIRNTPYEIQEAAFIDGASHWRVLSTIILPISLPALATITLFTFVGHWNSWFDGLIYMNRPSNYPLQTFLRTIIVRFDPNYITERDLKFMETLSNRNVKAAQIFLSMLPVAAVYPFLQRYFISGISVGSVKG